MLSVPFWLRLGFQATRAWWPWSAARVFARAQQRPMGALEALEQFRIAETLRLRAHWNPAEQESFSAKPSPRAAPAGALPPAQSLALSSRSPLDARSAEELGQSMSVVLDRLRLAGLEHAHVHSLTSFFYFGIGSLYGTSPRAQAHFDEHLLPLLQELGQTLVLFARACEARSGQETRAANGEHAPPDHESSPQERWEAHLSLSARRLEVGRGCFPPLTPEQRSTLNLAAAALFFRTEWSRPLQAPAQFSDFLCDTAQSTFFARLKAFDWESEDIDLADRASMPGGSAKLCVAFAELVHCEGLTTAGSTLPLDTLFVAFRESGSIASFWAQQQFELARAQAGAHALWAQALLPLTSPADEVLDRESAGFASPAPWRLALARLFQAQGIECTPNERADLLLRTATRFSQSDDYDLQEPLNFALSLNWDWNAQTSQGDTVLTALVRQGARAGVELLLRHGVDPQVRGRDGCNAFDFARALRSQSSSHEAIWQLLSGRAAAHQEHEALRLALSHEQAQWRQLFVAALSEDGSPGARALAALPPRELAQRLMASLHVEADALTASAQLVAPRPLGSESTEPQTAHTLSGKPQRAPRRL